MEPDPRARSRRATHRLGIVAAVTSFVLQPIPALDELIVVPMHYWLAVRLARIHGVPIKTLPWRSIQKIAWYGAGARLVANFSIGLVPVVGAFSNAITAIVLTEFLGLWLDAHLTDPTTLPQVTMASLRRMFSDAISRKERGENVREAAHAAAR